MCVCAIVGINLYAPSILLSRPFVFFCSQQSTNFIERKKIVNLNECVKMEEMDGKCEMEKKKHP